MCLDAEEAWIMQTSSGYEEDLFYEDAAHKDNRDTNEECNATKPVTEESDEQQERSGETSPNLQTNTTEKTESREEKIKKLKALIRKQEKAVDKLKPDGQKTAQKQSSLARSAENTNDKSRKTNHSPTAKGCSRRGLGTKPCRSRRRKLGRDDSVATCRDVDIWMSRGELMTKDEFLAVVGLVRVAKFHENL